MNGFRSDNDGLTARAGEFDDLAGQARRIADDLRRAVEATGQCWGSDEVGQRFGTTHVPASQDALRRIEHLPTRLAQMGSKLADTARTYRDVDEGNAVVLGESAHPGGQR